MPRKALTGVFQITLPSCGEIPASSMRVWTMIWSRSIVAAPERKKQN